MTDWMQDAACSGMDTNIFFPAQENVRARKAAVKVCRSCPVRRKCRDYADANRIDWGVWGGVPERPRQTMRREMQRKAAS